MRIPVFFSVFLTHGQFVSSLSVREPLWSAGRATSSKSAATASASSIKTYKHDGWTLSYRFHPASPGFERENPVLLVHPVGIGINSWFWERFLENWNEGPAVYAPDLIGCGIANGGDGWDPNERGLSFPLGWVKGVESLMEQHITRSGTFPSIMFGASKCVVVAQGGLAPVGVLLAARNANTVSHLVLTSPPTWKDMTTAVSVDELSRNSNLLSSPLVGPLAFGVLESTWAVNLFSNTFLFQDACDERWLDLACGKTTAADRPPVVAFNAGFCNHRSFEEELKRLSQPTLILCGKDDEGRTRARLEYVKEMAKCVIEELKGKNVLPWESPMEVVQAIKKSCYSKYRYM